MNFRRGGLTLLAFTILSDQAFAQSMDLTNLDLATLMDMDVTVTSASKRAQSGNDAAAAVYVLTHEDIERSGKTTIAELLRTVPGLQVARLANNRWAVTARGFSGRFANKLLVLIDGRSVYTSTFSGTLWEQQGIPVEEIARIEIVRGPGGALWGANAVNGVINIVTHRAADEPGIRISVGAGDDERGNGSLRIAGNAGDIGDYRFYVEGASREAFEENVSAWRSWQTGFRLDGEAAGGQFSVRGDIYKNDLGEFVFEGSPENSVSAHGGGIVLTWGTELDPGTLTLQGHYSHSDQHKHGMRAFVESIYSVDVQFDVKRIGRHQLTTGAQLRVLEDNLKGPPERIEYVREHTSQTGWNLYAQDEIYFLEDDLRLILGVKLEDLPFEGTAFQPTIRSLWHLNGQHTLWAAVSRAVRTPSRLELHSRIPIGPLPPFNWETTLVGSEGVRSEVLKAYELGWRWRPAHNVSADLAMFENRYEHIIGWRPGEPEPGTVTTMILPLVYSNLDTAKTHGAELALDWVVSERMRWQLSGTWLEVDAPSQPGVVVDFNGIDPKFSFSVQARMRLPKQLALDVAWRWVDEIPAWGISAYDSVDARLAWQPSDALEFSLSVDNAFGGKHVEFFNEESRAMGDALGRSVFARAVWKSRH